MPSSKGLIKTLISSKVLKIKLGRTLERLNPTSETGIIGLSDYNCARAILGSTLQSTSPRQNIVQKTFEFDLDSIIILIIAKNSAASVKG